MTPISTNTSLEELIKRYVAWKVLRAELIPKSAQALERTLHTFLTFAGTSERPGFTEENVSAWLGNPRWSKATIVGKLSHLRGWTAWLTRHDHIAEDPCAVLVSPRLARRVPRPGD